jgi:hypothetical protein
LTENGTRCGKMDIDRSSTAILFHFSRKTKRASEITHIRALSITSYALREKTTIGSRISSSVGGPCVTEVKNMLRVANTLADTYDLPKWVRRLQRHLVFMSNGVGDFVARLDSKGRLVVDALASGK